ncbi:putative nucleotidyltransferase, ribonuclease H [Tanacetum coccineum]
MVTTRRNSDDDVPNFEAMIVAAVANALPNLMATLRTQISNDIRNGVESLGGSGGGGGDALPQGIQLGSKVLGCPDNFKTRLAAFKLEGDALSWWKAHLRTQGFQGQDQRFTGRNGNDRQGQGNYNQRQHRGQSTRDFNQGHASGSANQRRSTETLPPPPLCTTCESLTPCLGLLIRLLGDVLLAGLLNISGEDFKKLNMTPTPLIERVIISTPMKNHMLIDHEYVNCPLRFADHIRSANLLLSIWLDFDVDSWLDWFFLIELPLTAMLGLRHHMESIKGIGNEIGVCSDIDSSIRFPVVFQIDGDASINGFGFCFDATWKVIASLQDSLKPMKLCVPNDQALRKKVITEAHSSPFTIHPGSTKMSRDLKQPFGDHVKWDEIPMDFLYWLAYYSEKDMIDWVVVDRLTKSAHFLPIRKNYGINPKFTSRFWKGLQKAWGTRLKFSTAFHPQTDGQSERTIQTLEDMLRACALEWTGSWDEYLCLVEFAYNNSWHASIKAAPFELLYGRKCRAPICWDEVGERLIEGPELIEITNEKVAVAKEKLKEARSRQKSYADKHRRDLEFQVGDRVFLKVSPFRGVKRFGIKGKLSPRFIGPFEILERIGEVSYRLALPPQLSHVHDVFHVSLLRGYHYHPLHVASYPFDQIQPDMSLSEEPESILDRQERVMRNKVIPFVKILWKNHPEREATWETEESMRASYPHFFV